MMIGTDVNASDRYDDDKDRMEEQMEHEGMEWDEPELDMNQHGFVSKAPGGAVSVEGLIGTEVVTRANREEIGEVEDILMSRNGKPLAVIIEVGGIWDLGDDHVALAWDRVTVSADSDHDAGGEEPDDFILVADVIEEVIEEAPGFEYHWD
jgi:hypothetical protein